MDGLYKFLLFHVLPFLERNELGSAIIDGKKAPDKSMLYMASVQNRKNQHLCGGFLVCQDLVVTAAHCDLDTRNTKVVLGVHNLRKVEKTTKYIKQIIKHPFYNNEKLENDIAFLKLGGRENWINKGRPIKLPSSEINIMEKCSVAGWGMTGVKKTVEELQVVNVQLKSCVINCSVVKREWSDLPANVTCAEKRLCEGDFGGPLVCNGIAVGVASFSKNKYCASSDEPDVYSDISKSLPWIRSVLKENGC